MKTRSSGNTHECNLCSFKSVTLSKLQQHFNEHIKEKLYECSLCTYKTHDKEILNKHIQEHYISLKLQIEKIDTTMIQHKKEKVINQCVICKKVYKYASTLRTHKSNVHDQKNMLQCAKCNFKCSAKNQMKCHMEKHSNMIHKCPKCVVTFKYFRNLTMHSKRGCSVKKVVGEKKLLTCEICSIQVRNASGVASHMITHSDYKAYQCEECGDKFKRKKNLRTHMFRRHIHKMKNQTFVECKICNMKFENNCSLKVHNEKHSDYRPFSCSVCHAGFKRNASLKLHMKTFHTKKQMDDKKLQIIPNQPFSCSLCRASFKREYGLKVHIGKFHKTE